MAASPEHIRRGPYAIHRREPSASVRRAQLWVEFHLQVTTTQRGRGKQSAGRFRKGSNTMPPRAENVAISGRRIGTDFSAGCQWLWQLTQGWTSSNVRRGSGGRPFASKAD